MAKKEIKKITLITTSIDGLDYDAYLEYCKDMDIEPEEEDSEEYWDWVYSERDLNLESDWENLKYAKIADSPCVLTGTLGLWNGHPDITPMYFTNLETAIKRCLRSADDYEVELEDGIINVYGHHHDGTNCFEVHLVSANGLKHYAKYSNEDLVEEELKDRFFKKIHPEMLW